MRTWKAWLLGGFVGLALAAPAGESAVASDMGGQEAGAFAFGVNDFFRGDVEVALVVESMDDDGGQHGTVR